MQKLFARFVNDESGATAIEYGLLAAIISVSIVGILGDVSESLNATFTSINEGLTN
jgi:pilus assembly protein Flp/PilA